MLISPADLMFGLAKDSQNRAKAREYVFPLRPGVDVIIRNLPTNLTAEEAGRIDRFLQTLIVENDK